MVDLTLHYGQAAPSLSFWQSVFSDPKNMFAFISALAALIGIAVSTISFWFTQRIQRQIKRAETMQKLVEWFAQRRKDNEGMRLLSDTLVYGDTWTFYKEDLNTEKEKSLARLLSNLNHLAFHVDLGIINSNDLGRTEPGYYFTVMLQNESVIRYLNHIAENDRKLGLPEDSGFIYVRKYGAKISRSSTHPVVVGGLLAAPPAQRSPKADSTLIEFAERAMPLRLLMRIKRIFVRDLP